MEMTLVCIFDTRILAHSKNVIHKLAWLLKQLHADDISPYEYECRRCHTRWNDAVLTKPQEVSCSNCYSDNIVISQVRLIFQNWGEQNCGRKEQILRFAKVLKMTSAHLT